MLAPKVIAAVIFVWVIGVFLGGIFELAMMGAADRALLNEGQFYNVVTTGGTWGPMQVAAQATDFLDSTWRMITFQFAFIYGDWELIRWIIFAPFTGMIVYGLIMMVIGILRGTLGST